MTNTEKSSPSLAFFNKDMKFAMNFSFLLLIISAAVWITLNYASFLAMKEDVELLQSADVFQKERIASNSDSLKELNLIFDTIKEDIKEIKDALKD